MNKDTGELRALAKDEEPPGPEWVTWEVGEPIKTLDEARVAQAVAKRLLRRMRNIREIGRADANEASAAVRAQLDIVKAALEEWAR